MLAYISHTQPPLNDSALSWLLQQSQARNARLSISGLLLHSDGYFLQYLEGPPDSIEAVWSSIKSDPRHGNVVLLFDEARETRLFSGWSMGFHAPTPDQMASLMRQATDATHGRIPNSEWITRVLGRLRIGPSAAAH
jgi:hypothetical protein